MTSLVLGFPPRNKTFPSYLTDLKVELVQEAAGYRVNISWAINIDGRIQSLLPPPF